MADDNPRDKSRVATKSWWRHPEGGLTLRGAGTFTAGATALGALITAISIGVAASNDKASGDVVTGQTVTMGDTNITYVNPQLPATVDPDPTAPDPCSQTTDGAVNGWGPTRPTFTVDEPPNYASLNALRDNPNYGDERGLMTVKDRAIATAGGWEYEVEVERGHTYSVRMYVHNSAPAALSGLVARETTVAVSLPTCTGLSIPANGFLRSFDAFPDEVYGGVVFRSSERFNLAYVEGSAMFINNAHPDGLSVEASFLTAEGALVGSDGLDGRLEPGWEGTGYFVFEVRPQFAPEDG